MFATLEAARELKLRERAEFLSELVGIAAIPNQSLEYVKSLQSFYSDLSQNAVPDFGKKKSDAGVSSWEHASQIMWSAMKTKKRLECGQ